MYKDNEREYKVIGICVSGIQDESVKVTCMALGREAIKRGYKVLIFGSFNNLFYDNIFSHGESSIFSLVNPELLDVLFVLPESIKREEVWRKIIADAKAAGLPVVSINHPGEGCSHIVWGYKETFEKICRHIVEDHGCRRVNFIAGQKGNSFSEERLDCYKKVLKENGIEYDQTRVGYGDFWEKPTIQVMETFLKDERGLPEAIICCNDTMAITACQELRAAGIKVPDDVIVTGFDGIELEKYYVPRLTTAGFDFGKMSAAAMDMADLAIAGEPMPEEVEVPFMMRRSESCGCIDVPDESYSEKVLELYNIINASEGHEEHMFAYVYHTVEFMDFDRLGAEMVRFADYFTWCCLNTDFINDTHEEERYHTYYTPRMLMLMSCLANKVTQNVEFDTKDLLPGLGEVLDRHDILMFMPMHYQDEIMGYMAVSINTDNFNFTNTHRFLNHTNQIFENLKNRMRLQTAYAQMAEMHMRDPMTNIYNRRGFYFNVSELSRRLGNSVSYIIFSMDLDGLKLINDTYGHSNGDIALITASKIISGGCGRECVCARFGGDEFIVLAADTDPEKCIRDYCERVERELNDYNASAGQEFSVGISIGAAVLPGLPDPDSIDEAMKQADRKMYEIKKTRHCRD